MGEHLPCKQGVTSSSLVFSMDCESSRRTLKTEYKCRVKNRKKVTKVVKKKKSLIYYATNSFSYNNWSSKKGHRANALALGADERRDKLR